MFLDRMVETKRQEVAALAAALNRREVKRGIAQLPPCHSLISALTAKKRRSVGLIAEVKKASPSKGVIRQDFDPEAIVRGYEAAGADALSVLTDRIYFQGGNDILRAVRSRTELPVLRKEFIIDELQLQEARLIGADAVLLIAAILNDNELARLNRCAFDLGMETLIEVHDEQELQRVLALDDAPLIGINNRNLHTFVTDLEQSERLRALVPADRTLVSESGIHKPEHMNRLADRGVDAALVGEHLMRQPDVEAAVEQLMSGLPRVAV
ncbi:indole-3-glycerol phosphate synthase TrpC [Paenibacillus popilliae]|uniref:Indole-3-glycerol phosphate synthase n=1 Tax=Paenibacillus popilliae ATCC 14706 TaxID=1212764 RepID=M9LNC7_PAEPP|nr:indole-3-glycerol phosphate synthase TrpC [Paenibacillus popilliae]GAC41846.1 indole-3-glycerol phosphate synthase [Paenibacillus popilliae ATCC 14706]